MKLARPSARARTRTRVRAGKQSSAARAELASDERGAVYVEFLLAFPPLFLLFLGLVQLGLLQGARLVVQQAAREGVRSAAVVLPDPHARYDGVPPHTLNDGSTAQTPQVTEADRAPSTGPNDAAPPPGGTELIALLTDLVPSLELPDAVSLGAETAPARVAAVRRAVYVRLSALTPDPRQLLRAVPELSPLSGQLGLRQHDSVADAIGGSKLARFALGMAGYNDTVTAVRFPKQRGGEEVHEQDLSPPPDLLHLRVTYLFRCSIPLVSALLCQRLTDLGVDPKKDEISAATSDPLLAADLEAIPARGRLRLLALSQQRFFVLREEASFPYQHAPYTVASDP